jgi:phosphate transport system substrate-binding protein
MVTTSGATKLKWTGCGITKKAFMAEAVKAYKAKTGVLISLSGGGATKGIRATNAGKADIGGSCRNCLSTKFADEEGATFMTVVAWDAIVPIVHKSNPVKALTSQQLKDIMQGKLTNWKDVGGPDQDILVVVRTGKINGVGLMARKILYNNPEMEFSKKALVVKSSGPLENKIQTDPAAIGITGISSATKRISEGKPLTVVKVDGNEATVANIGSGAYPTLRPLYLMTKGAPAGETKKFIDWLLSDEGQKVVETAGTVSLQQGAGLKAKFKYWENTNKITNFNDLP